MLCGYGRAALREFFEADDCGIEITGGWHLSDINWGLYTFLIVAIMLILIADF